MLNDISGVGKLKLMKKDKILKVLEKTGEIKSLPRNKERHEKLWPFLRGYEKLILEYGFKLDTKGKECHVVKLPWNFEETVEYYRYIERIVDRAVDGDIVIEVGQ